MGDGFCMGSRFRWVGGEISASSGALPLCTRESTLDGRQIVEVERRDQMKVGRAPRGCNRTLDDLVLSETGDFLRDRNVVLEVVFVKSNKILRSPVNRHEPNHCVAPYG